MGRKSQLGNLLVAMGLVSSPASNNRARTCGSWHQWLLINWVHSLICCLRVALTVVSCTTVLPSRAGVIWATEGWFLFVLDQTQCPKWLEYKLQVCWQYLTLYPPVWQRSRIDTTQGKRVALPPLIEIIPESRERKATLTANDVLFTVASTLSLRVSEVLVV